jgi:hypothetical protein
MNHFPIAYAGNKRSEFVEIDKFINYDNIDTVIEPFCGTASMSYKIASKYPKRFKYILNDNNKYLTELYNVIKSGGINNFIDYVHKLLGDIKNKDDYVKACKMEDLKNWFIKNKFYNIRFGTYNKDMHNKDMQKKKMVLTKEQLKFIDFVVNENVVITNDDWFKCFSDNKDNDKCLFLMDPPYVQTCNDFYLDPTLNVYEYFLDNQINTFKAQIMFILEHNWIIKMLFGSHIKHTYNKTYNVLKKNKKNTLHCIINNYILP